MILEIDAGNTRIKWRLLATEQGVQQSLERGFAVSDRSEASLQNLKQQLLDVLPDQLERVRVASVRGTEFELQLAELIFELTSLHVEFARVSAECAGVRNAYPAFSSMGVDRWLAMLAAYRKAGRGCCVLDVGSAMTLDLLDSSGQHLGGYIVPGIKLMQEALAGKSKALPYKAISSASVDPGISTDTAINHGILAMCLGLMERVRHLESSEELDWFITGGDAALISSLTPWPHKLIPELVMDGLAMALP